MAARQIAAAVLGAALCAGVASAQGRGPTPGPALARQLAALQAEKRARTPAQRKIEARLLHADRQRRGLRVAADLPALRTGVRPAPDGSVLVDVRGVVTPGLPREVERLGGHVVSALPARGHLRARLPLGALEALAALPEVSRIREALPPRLGVLDVSEGDGAHRADELRRTFAVSGSGVRVGVLSDGVDALASLQASGDLPAVTVLPGMAGSGSEGTAMLEIVHDLAPGAELLFATAFGGEAVMAANVAALRAAGADVIVDDVFYFEEGILQDDVIAAEVDAAAASGALFFSSAGNGGHLDAGTAGVWEGDFTDSGFTLDGFPVHDFGGGLLGNAVTTDTPFFFTLQWADPLGGASNDFDLVLVDPAITQILAASTDIQDGDDDPFEVIPSQLYDDTGNRLLVVIAVGSGRFLHLDTNRGALESATDGATGGHAGASGALGVAAVDAALAAGGAFTGSEGVESFSADGPRRVFFASDGSPFTPGDFSSTGGELRAKPDLAAADCVATATPGFSPFCGTSAAAPHAAALAALLLELGAPVGAGAAEVETALRAGALDLSPPGADRNAGDGLVDGFAAALALDPAQCANGVDDDGDGAIDAAQDPGCDGPDDPAERSALLACDDGLDDDGDGTVDLADPGCSSPWSPSESPKCQDGLDNDGDGGIDFDGGAAANGGVALGPPDPNCVSPARDREGPSRCGLGFEGSALAGALLAWRRRRARGRAAAGRSEPR